MANTTNYTGNTFNVPTTAAGLEDLVADSESDGCTFTYAELDACGVTPPQGTQGHEFIVAYGDLCAYPQGSDDLAYVWVGGTTWTTG